MEGERVARTPGPTPSPGGGSPDSDTGHNSDLRRNASITPGDDPKDGAVPAGPSASGSAAFATPLGRAFATTPNVARDDDGHAGVVPAWAWVPRCTEVFALADPAKCRPYMSPPVETEDRRSPRVAEALFFAGDGETFGDEETPAWRLGETSEGSEYAAVIRDSTTRAFEVRARADWHPASVPGTETASPSASPSPSPRFDDKVRAFSFLTPTADSDAASASHAGPETPGFGINGGTGAEPDANENGPPEVSFASLSLKSAFTNKYLQARKKPPHAVQFYSDRRGVYETWELVGGACSVLDNVEAGDVDDHRHKKERYRPWGTAPVQIETAWLARLGARSFCVARSRTSPKRALLLVRLRLPSGESPWFDSPGSVSGHTPQRARRPPRHSAPNSSHSGDTSMHFSAATPPPIRTLAAGLDRIRAFSPDSPRSSRGGGSPGTSEVNSPDSFVDAMDVMAMSGKLLKGFALKPEAKARRSAVAGALHAWRLVVDGKHRQKLLTIRATWAWAKRRSGKVARAWRVVTTRRAASRARFAQALSAVAAKAGEGRGESKWFASLVCRSWHNVARACIRSTQHSAALTHRASVFATAGVAGRAFRAWRAATTAASVSEFSWRRATACVSGFKRRKRREAFTLWRLWTRSDTKRRMLATLDASLARNESRALFTAVRESRRLDTLRDCSQRWRRYVARVGIGKAHCALAEKVLDRRKVRKVFSEWLHWIETKTRLEKEQDDLAKEQHEKAARHWYSAYHRGCSKLCQTVFHAWRLRVCVERLAVSERNRAVFFHKKHGHGVFARSFHKWAQMARAKFGQGFKLETSGRRLARAVLFATRVELRNKRSAFKAYVSCVRTAKRTRRAIQTLIVRRIRNVTFPAFSEWREITKALRRVKRVGDLAKARRATRTVGFAFRVWENEAHVSKAAKRRDTRAAVFHGRLSLRRASKETFHAFAAWTDAFRYRNSVANFVRMAKNRSRRVTVALALTKWKVSVVTAKVFRAAGVVAVARDQRRNQRKRFEAWRLTTVQEKNAHGRKVRFAYARRAGRALQCAREGFREWERLCMENKNMVAQFRVARDRRFFVLVFRAWRTEARDAKAEKRAESIVSRRRDARALKVKSDAVFEWHAVARTHALAKTIGAAIKAAAAQAKEAIKARDTADAAATQTRREEAKQQAARVRAGCETRAARFAARREVVLRNAVFLAWRALVADVARARLGVDTAWRRHCSRLCAVSFDKWCVNTARARLVRRSCRAISKRRGFRTKRDVFRYWLVHTKAQRKSLRVLVSCLVRRTRCVLVDTWRVWVVQVRETKRFTRTLEKFSNEKSAKLRHEIFKRWRFRSVATATAKKQTLREARAFDKISLRRIVRLKKEALRAWLHGCRDAIRENKVLTRRANRRSDKLCARFFFTWRDVCRASRRETYLVAKLAKRWARVSLVTRFERWRASVSENARHVRFVVSLKKKKRERVLCLAFQTWRTRVSETRREEYLVSKIAKRRAKASLSSAFCVWCSVTTQSKRDAQFIETQSKRDRCLMAKIAKRWARVSLARAFGFWRCRSVAIREHAFVTKKHDRLVSKITTRFVRSVLNYWLVVVTHHKAQRVFAMNVAARWIEDTKGEYFYGWRSLVTGVRRARAALKCLDNKRAFVVTKERFQTWRVWGTKASSLRRRTYAVIARAKHRVFAKAWKGWFRVIERARELDSAVVGRVAHFARRVRRRHARQAFLSLKRNCQLTLHARDAAYVLIQHWHRRRVAVRFRKWRDVVYRGAYTRALSRTALQRRWQLIGRCAFAAWRARVRRVQSFAKKCDVADVKFHAARRKLNAKSWAVWVKFAISQIQAKRCVDKEQFDWMRAATESERAQKQKLVSDLERAKRFATDLSSQMEEIRLECVKLRSIAEIRNAESTELKQAVLDKDTALAKLLAERDVVRGWREGGLLLQGDGDGVDTINKKPKRKALGWADAVGTGVVGEAADVIFGDETDLTTREPWSPPAMHGAYKDRHTPDDNIEHDAKTAGSDHSEKETEDEDDDSDAKEVHYDDESADLNSPELIPLQTNSAAGDVEHFSSPPASASGGSRLDRALRLGAAASCMVTRRTKVFSSKKSETNETARTATPNATRRVPTATPTGGTTAAPRRVSSSSKTPKTPRFETPKSLSEKEGGVFKTGDPSFFTASALKQEAYVARHNKQDEGLTRGSVKTTPTTYANVRPFAAGLDSQSSARAVFQVECENPALCDALEIHLNRGGVIFRKTHGFDKVFFEGVDEGNKEGAELDTCNASALGRAAMETAAPMADATRGGSDATLFVVGAAGGGKTVWADATCASLAARLLAVASHKNQRLARLERIASDANLSMLNNSPGASSVSGTKSVPSMTTKVCLRVCVYETKGLAVTDLLAEHGGNVSLRLWPRALGAVVPISGQLDVSGGGQVSHTTHRASTHEPGLAYEVEDGLTKCLIGSAEDAARVLRAARRRRCDTSHKKSLPADSCVTEFWVETVTTVTSAAFGVRSRVSRSARARVVDVHDGHEGKGNSNSATFALAQCAGRLALNASHDEGDDAFESKAKKTIDWRQSALLKLAKGALCGEDFVSVAVAFGASAAQAESAQTGLRFASAVRRRNWGRYAPAVPSLVGNAVRSDEAQRESLADDNGTDLVSSATRVTRTVDETVSRRDSLARKLAATRVEARRNIR